MKMKWLLLLLVVLCTWFFWPNMMRLKYSMRSVPQLENPYSPASPLHADHQAFIDKVNADPRILGRLADAGSEDAAYRAWNSMLSEGARTLPRARLLRVVRIEVAVMEHLPVASCAKLMRPHRMDDEAVVDAVSRAFEKLPPFYHRTMVEFSYEALRAQVNNTPPIMVDPLFALDAQQSLGTRFTGEHAERVMRVLANPEQASDEDACWAGNTLLHTVTEMPEDQADALLRTFVLN
jgi:hypothetical protein